MGQAGRMCPRSSPESRLEEVRPRSQGHRGHSLIAPEAVLRDSLPDSRLTATSFIVSKPKSRPCTHCEPPASRVRKDPGRLVPLSRRGHAQPRQNPEPQELQPIKIREFLPRSLGFRARAQVPLSRGLCPRPTEGVLARQCEHLLRLCDFSKAIRGVRPAQYRGCRVDSLQLLRKSGSRPLLTQQLYSEASAHEM